MARAPAMKSKATKKAQTTAAGTAARAPQKATKKARVAKAPARKAVPGSAKKTARPTTGAEAASKRPAAAARAAKGESGYALKTRAETTSVAGFIKALDDPQQRADSQILVQMMRAATGCEPVMWGGSIIGFDRYRYRYDSGHEGEMALIGFAPRKGQLVLYVMPGSAADDALLAKLGRHKTGKSCLYLRRLADVDAEVLGRIVRAAVEEMRRRHPH